MISEKALEITETIYKMYGSDSRWLFGISPDHLEAIHAIVEATIFVYKHDEAKESEQ